jgi:ABC-type Fe3+-hydroxamate transport system substrate-binding protein
MKFIRVLDDRKKVHEWRSPPQRIVSLVPSDTYSLVRLGAGARLLGRTRYCVAPEDEVLRIEMVGGTKDADIDRIIALEPDLVVANQEENSRRDIERLDAAGLRVLVSFPQRVAAGVAHLARLARALGLDDRAEPARSLIARAYHTHRAAEAKAREVRPLRTFCPIWMDPLMTANGSTFLSDVLALVGAENVFKDRERRYPLAADLGRAEPLPPERVEERDVRYPRITLEEVTAKKPELVLLPDEPHPFTEADAEVFRGLDIPAAGDQVVFCDGKDLMWYGARSVEGLDRLRALIDRARADISSQASRSARKRP